MKESDVTTGITFLADVGLNLLAVLDCATLPETIATPMLTSTDYLAPLQQLGAWADWSHPLPLGQGIHPEFGVWFAYRAAYLTTAELPLRVEPERPSPCGSCAAEPCITASPVGACHFANSWLWAAR